MILAGPNAYCAYLLCLQRDSSQLLSKKVELLGKDGLGSQNETPKSALAKRNSSYFDIEELRRSKKNGKDFLKLLILAFP